CAEPPSLGVFASSPRLPLLARPRPTLAESCPTRTRREIHVPGTAPARPRPALGSHAAPAGSDGARPQRTTPPRRYWDVPAPAPGAAPPACVLAPDPDSPTPRGLNPARAGKTPPGLGHTKKCGRCGGSAHRARCHAPSRGA